MLTVCAHAMSLSRWIRPTVGSRWGVRMMGRANEAHMLEGEGCVAVKRLEHASFQRW